MNNKFNSDFASFIFGVLLIVGSVLFLGPLFYKLMQGTNDVKDVMAWGLAMLTTAMILKLADKHFFD
jgi:hypothetical protein